MEKPIITRAQAEAINSCKIDDEDKVEAIRHHINTWCAPPNRCLNELSLGELVEALYVGYEVEVEELEPQFEVGDWVINAYNNRIFQLEQSEVKDFFELLPTLKHIRHATESEIAEEEKRRMDKKINEIWIGLSDYERNGLYKKFECGDY